MDTKLKTAVYDLPTRIFHWLFATLFLGAYLIAENVDDETMLFSLHMMAGLTIAFMLVLRLFWGFFGTTYARFSSFKLQPVELIQYFKDAFTAKTKRYVGHNPASSYAAILMFISAFGLAVTGIMMSVGNNSDFYEETHELLANLFLITVLIHVGGIIFHQLRHRDSLWSSMVNGSKKSLSTSAGIKNMKRVTGILFLVLTLSWMSYMYNQYDTKTQTVILFGIELNLGDDH